MALLDLYSYSLSVIFPVKKSKQMMWMWCFRTNKEACVVPAAWLPGHEEG